MWKVLVTRPADDAERLGLRLEENGFLPIVAPLLTLVPHLAPRPCSGGVAAVMATSHNAIEALRDRQDAVRDILARPCFCVGQRTAEAARRFGFRDVMVSYGDGRVLADLLQKTIRPSDGVVLHPCGMDRIETGSDILRASGYDVRAWEVYRAEAATVLPDAVKALLVTQSLDAALFFSPRTAAIFGALTRLAGVDVFCRRMVAVGLSEAVAASLRLLPLDRILVADVLTEESMIQTLRSAFDDHVKKMQGA